MALQATGAERSCFPSCPAVEFLVPSLWRELGGGCCFSLSPLELIQCQKVTKA